MFISSGPDQKVRDAGGKIQNLVKTAKHLRFMVVGCKKIVVDFLTFHSYHVVSDFLFFTLLEIWVFKRLLFFVFKCVLEFKRLAFM